jgi:hypothetical protein
MKATTTVPAYPALSVLQPWATALVTPCGLRTHDELDVPVKDIENRTWHPPRWMVPGTWFAVHASMTNAHDPQAWSFIRARWAKCPSSRDLPFGVIVGLVRLRDVRSYQDVPTGEARWAMGPVCWRTDAAIKLPTPIPARGSLGVWHVEGPRGRDLHQALSEMRASGARIPDELTPPLPPQE